MIIREYGKYRLSCDVCEEQHETIYNSYMQAFMDKKREGYIIKKEKDHFVDICVDCQVSKP